MNWKWLVDPPEHLRKYYSQAFISYYCGPEFTKIFTMIYSILGIAFSCYFLFFFIDNKFALAVLYIIIFLIIIIFVTITINKKIVTNKVSNTPLPEYFKTDDGNIICNKCGYKQPFSNSCSNCFHIFY
jgi:hypothetical protein